VTVLISKENKIRLEKGDLTMMDIESIVFYARHDLILGSGFGNAISVRGGPSIQKELKSFGTINTCDVVVTNAGELKAKYIIHAVGPRFQEPALETKLQKTILNTLQVANKKQIQSIALPAMGTGFYGIPLELSARVMCDVISVHLSGDTNLEKVVICVNDQREYQVFQKVLANI